MRIIQICIIFLMISFNAEAQQNKRFTEKQKKEIANQFQEYFETLNLTPDQKSKYLEINKSFKSQIELINNSGLDKKQKIKELKEIQDNKNAKILNVLNDEQYKLYVDYQQKRRENMLANNDGEFAEYIKRLNLSEDQKEPFAEISKRYAIQLKDLKNSGKSRYSKYKEYKNIERNKLSEMKVLLSKEQLKVYKELQEEVKKKLKEKRKS